jgi:hypothetical protein
MREKEEIKDIERWEEKERKREEEVKARYRTGENAR